MYIPFLEILGILVKREIQVDEKNVATPISTDAEIVGALRMTLLLGAPMLNKFQDPDTKTLTMTFLRISSPWLKKILNFNARE